MNMDDGVKLHVEDVGEGPVILFVHEFGGDWRTWDGLFEELKVTHRCIRFSARGFLPSGIPYDLASYGQDRQVRDILNIVEQLGLTKFNLAGLSMGSFTSLLFALKYPDQLLSLTLMGCSSGPGDGTDKSAYHNDLNTEIDLLKTKGGIGAVEWFESDSAYRRVHEKDPIKWKEYLQNLKSQSVIGALNTLGTVHWRRSCLYEMSEQLQNLPVPTLLIHGDEDHHRISPTNEFLEKILPCCKREILSRTGHLVHIEEHDFVLTKLALHVRSDEGLKISSSLKK